MLHELKTHSEYFNAIAAGTKTFEIRKDDQSFQKGDQLLLKDYNPFIQKYTGRILHRQVTYIIRGGNFGIKKGYCIMALEKI
ncbi:DUF3850 domain-containing protein [uncultured Chryseobacterium sp.]|uniref:DUF3850 domain-containing protein n=1 Tax=uncultured Chryseobacterium sp. TaxID=259322 RepID=UPI00345D5028